MYFLILGFLYLNFPYLTIQKQPLKGALKKPITYLQFLKFSNYLRCLRNLRITELHEVFRCKLTFI